MSPKNGDVTERKANRVCGQVKESGRGSGGEGLSSHTKTRDKQTPLKIRSLQTVPYEDTGERKVTVRMGRGQLFKGFASN